MTLARDYSLELNPFPTYARLPYHSNGSRCSLARPQKNGRILTFIRVSTLIKNQPSAIDRIVNPG